MTMLYTVYSAFTDYTDAQMTPEDMEEYIRVVRKHFPHAEFEISPVLER